MNLKEKAVKWLASPIVIAFLALSIGHALVIVGIYMVAGIGWAYLIASWPFLVVAYILVRGVLRG